MAKGGFRGMPGGMNQAAMMKQAQKMQQEMLRMQEEMLRDSDCQEERATIKRYIDKIKNIN